MTIGGVPEHFNVPWHMALNGPHPAVGGVTTTWRDVPEGTGEMCRALSTGELDVAVLLTEGIVKHLDGGGTARIVGMYTASPLIWGIHVSAGGRIARMEDLEGATFAISREGSGSHLMAQLDAAQRGWPEPHYVVVGDLEGGRSALLSGRADAFMWEKTMTLPLVLDGTFRRVGEFAGPWPAFAIAASAHAIAEGLDWLPAVLDAVRAACATAESDVEATVRFIGDRYAIPADDILRWLDVTQWNCTQAVSSSMLEVVVRVLADAGVLNGRPAPSSLIAPPGELIA